jgi:urease gamma subunit
MKMPSYQILKNGDEPVGILDEGSMKQDQLQGMSLSDSLHKNLTPLQLGGGGKVLMDYIAKNPDATPSEIYGFASANNIPIKAVTPIVTEIQKQATENAKDDRQTAMFQHSDESQQRQFAQQSAQQARQFAQQNALFDKRITTMNGSPESLQLQADAILKGLKAPSSLPKRGATYNTVMGMVYTANPNFDEMKANSVAAMMNNAVIQQKGATLAVVPEILGKTVDAGIKLNYPDAKFAALAQQWTQGQVNDPALAKYMALRNDSLMTIAGVMRGNGMTDLSHQVEMEAQHPTQSPRALKGWIEGQLTSFDPRMKSVNDLLGGRLKPTQAVVQGQTWGPNGPTGPAPGVTQANIPGNIQSRVVGGLQDGQPFTFQYHGTTYTGKRQGGKLAFD